MNHRSAIFPVLVLLLTCSLSLSHSGAIAEERSKQASPRKESSPTQNPELGGEEVRIRLLDGRTGEAIADAEVTFDRSLVIPCIRPPCPSYGKKWVRRTDREGVVAVPTAEIHQSRMTGSPQRKETAILVSGYLSRDYVETDVRAGSAQLGGIELDPSDEREKGNIRLKFLEVKTGKQLSNRRVWLTRLPKANIWLRRTPDCLPSKCPEYWIDKDTNRLGNIYYPSRMLVPSWIFVEGYEFVRFSPDWIKNNQVFLEKSD